VKSSKRGSLKIVPPSEAQGLTGDNIKSGSTKTSQMTSQDVISPTEQSIQSGFIYGWKPDHALAQISYRPDESWLIYQAQSILGTQNVTLEDAKEFFKIVNITTRQPIVAAAPSRPSGILSALRALVGVGIVLVSISGCTRDPQGPAQIESEDTTYITNIQGKDIQKFYDQREGVVCYVVVGYQNSAISCMVAKPGDNQ
jgi:hypothetical protein